ncbi:MAG: DUF5668 domain-containing protein [Patescibacteria group bacterium]
MFFGALLMLVGLVLLAQNVGLLPQDFWSVLWPAVLIALGVSLLMKKGNCWHGWCGLDCGCGKKK